MFVMSGGILHGGRTMKAFIAAILFGFVVIVAGCSPSEETGTPPDTSTNAPSTNAPAN
jgi:hypothetical protein